MATKLKGKPLSPAELQDLVDVPTGAAMLFVSKKTVMNWLSLGTLSRYKVNGGRTLISKRELMGLIRKEA